MYEPKPIDTSGIELPDIVHALGEQLAEHVHDVWAQKKIADGNTDHPDLVPYSELPETTKDYDRNTAFGTLKAIYAAGFKIVPA
jgi:hypothetical protein